MERKSYAPWRCGTMHKHDYDKVEKSGAFGKAHFFLGYFGRWLSSLLLGAPWGYGERVLNALVITGLTVLGFACLFSRSGGIEKLGSQSVYWFDYLLYSLASFVLVNFSDLAPVTLRAKYLTVAESFLGLITFAIFVNALGRRIGGR
jgi:hypothetical protein